MTAVVFQACKKAETKPPSLLSYVYEDILQKIHFPLFHLRLGPHCSPVKRTRPNRTRPGPGHRCRRYRANAIGIAAGR